MPVDIDVGRPEGIQEYVTRYLIRSMVSGSLPAGTRLSPAQLAAALGVSHTPVREALAALEAMGQVERTPQVGYFVRSLSTTDIEEIYRLRSVLEDEAIRIAMPLLTEDDLEQMRDLDRQIRALGPRDTDGFIELNRKFHFVPFERTESKTLLRFITQLWDSSERYMHALAGIRVPETMQFHHERILEAFETRDAEAVNQWMARHRGVPDEALELGRSGGILI